MERREENASVLGGAVGEGALYPKGGGRCWGAVVDKNTKGKIEGYKAAQDGGRYYYGRSILEER